MTSEPINGDLEARKRNALTTERGAGAVFHHSHLVRKQEVIPVTKTDLEDIASFDALSAMFSSLGMFLFSGSAWILVEQIIGLEKFSFTPLVSFCAACLFFGFICFGAGFTIWRKKRSRLIRIYAETEQGTP